MIVLVAYTETLSISSVNDENVSFSHDMQTSGLNAQVFVASLECGCAVRSWFGSCCFGHRGAGAGAGDSGLWGLTGVQTTEP